LRKKILILTYRYPFKNGPHCSFGQNIFYEALRSQFEVKGICIGDKDETDDNFIAIKWDTGIIKKIFNLVQLKPIRQSHYHSILFQKAIDKILDTFKPDFIYVEHTVMAQYVKLKIPGIKIIFYDDESIIYVKSHKLLKTFKERTKNLFMERAEWEAIKISDIILTISDQERDFLRKKSHNKIIEYVPYGIDTAYYYYNWEPDKDKIKILFLGNYDHYPNREAVKFIFKELSPRFLDNKQVEFIIVGRNTKEIKNLIRSNMKVYDDVGDVRKFYWTSTLFIAPIFYGGGLRTKILEAASCGVPIIMSSLANNGFNFMDKEEVLVAETAEDYINIFYKILSEKYSKYLLKLSNNAAEKIKSNYSINSIQSRYLNYLSL